MPDTGINIFAISVSSPPPFFNIKNNNMVLIDLVEGYICLKEGHSVSGQFNDSFENDNFEDQNCTALKYISTHLTETLAYLNKIVLDENSTGLTELQDYHNNLKTHLNQYQ